MPNNTRDKCFPCFAMPVSGLLLLAACLSAFAFVFIMQYGFGLEPCVLCLWQRIPFAICLFLTALLCLWRPYGKQTQILLGLSSFVFCVGACLAAFHTGVERHWWLGTSGCSIHPVDASSVEDLREKLLLTVVARCDEIRWTFLGLSMANWNVPFSLGLAGYSLGAALQMKKKP